MRLTSGRHFALQYALLGGDAGALRAGHCWRAWIVLGEIDVDAKPGLDTTIIAGEAERAFWIEGKYGGF